MEISSQDVGSQQPLNGLDIALRCIDDAIRVMGYPGFETQMLVWTKQPLDAARLRRGLARLGRRHPVITSRLIEDPAERELPVWRFQPGELPRLDEISLPSGDAAAALAAAGKLLSTPRDPTRHDPLRFHLLHRPGGGDVFLLQYNHTLMDNSATALVLREIEELGSDSAATADDRPRYEPPRLVGHFLRTIPPRERRTATTAALDLQTRTLRGKAALLGDDLVNKPLAHGLRIVERTLEPEELRAIRARAIQVCGLPNLSMTILASAFRAVQQLGPAERNAGRRYMAGIGLDLNLRAGGAALFQNLLGLVAVNARSEELPDHEGLVRMLSAQMRDRLVQRHDIGIMRAAHLFQRRHRFVSWGMGHVMRYSCTLWYAYFGALDALGPRFCGAEIDRIHYVGPTWSPMGIAMLANQFCGRLSLHLTHDPDLVPPPLAAAYLDRIVADLREFARL